MEKHTKDSPLREKTLNFAVRIVDLNKKKNLAMKTISLIIVISIALNFLTHTS